MNESNIKKQLVFIDDAGDPGFKFDRGSTRYFVIACIIFDTSESAEATATTLRQLRVDFSWNKKHEFKFNKLRKAVNRESHIISDFNTTDSKQNDLIQLADLIAGALYRSKVENQKQKIITTNSN